MLSHTKPNITKFGNGKAEMYFDLYIKPVSNSSDLIMIYGMNVHDFKIWWEICEEKQYGTSEVRSSKFWEISETPDKF